MRASTSPRRLAACVAVVGATALTLSSCSNSSQPAGAPGAAAGSTSSTTSGTSAKVVDACTLVTAAELSQAVGVQYTAIQGSDGSFCNVTGANVPDSFFFIVEKEGVPPNTWDAQVAIIKRDDGSETSVSGIGDRAAQGAVKEFAAEAKGYIVLVTNADFNNPATAGAFTRSKAIAQLLISKL
jgi:hypothetical protein